jgi:hypothetical protein
MTDLNKYDILSTVQNVLYSVLPKITYKMRLNYIVGICIA